MKYSLFIIVLLIFKATLSFSQTDADTTLSPVEFIEESGNSLNIQEKQDQAALDLVLSDSLYVKRLSALPFDFRMTYNPIVKRYIELYTVRIKDKLQLILGLSEFYFPIFDEVLRSYQLPLELKYIAIIESALNPRAISRTRAVGLWQFMKGTAKENGLTINSNIDQRRGFIESTTAAAKYLKTLYGIYNDWQLVLAAYDCGPGNVNRAIRKSGGKRDFWEIYRYLPRETRGYVPEYIGAAYAMNYYKDHHILPIPAVFPSQLDTITITKNLHFGQIASVLGIEMDLLRKINPQYLRDFVPASEKFRYALYIPSDQKAKFIEFQDSIYTYRSSFYKTEFQRFKITSRSENPAGSTKVIHRVRSGENLSYIATHYHVTIKKIKDWNNLIGSRINMGQKLIVYVPKSREI